MNRLTKKRLDTVCFVDCENNNTLLTPHEMNSHHNRLAIQKLEKYESAEEQGRILRIPCKVGDTVYVKLSRYSELEYAAAEVRDFTYFLTCGFCIVVTSDKFDKQNIPFSEFGRTVFLTEKGAKEN